MELQIKKPLRRVGVSSPIHDGRAKAAGRQIYVADMQLPQMQYAVLVYSTIPHGEVLAVDDTAALALPGVHAVLTTFNTTAKKYNRAKLADDGCSWQEQLFPKRVRFIGDRVAMVVADSLAIAKEAAALLRIRYRPLPHCVTMAEAKEPTAPKLHGESNVFGEAEMNCGQWPQEEGLVDTVSSFRVGRLHHGAMETHCCVADYQPDLPALTVWTPCQSVFSVRTGIADLLELPYHQVRVIKGTMGGSFGSKQENILEPLTALAALTVKRPVKLVFSREEAMLSTVVRGEMEFQVHTKATPSGKVLALEVDSQINAGAYLTNSLDYIFAMGDKLGRTYAIPCIRYHGRAVCTNTPVAGGYRSWGTAEVVAAIEHHMDQLAAALQMDPVELRRQNVQRPGGSHALAGISVGNCQLLQCLEQGAQTFAWAEKQQICQKQNQQQGRYRRGVGVAAGAHMNGFYPTDYEYAMAAMQLHEDGTVTANICLHDHGCGTITAFQKIIGEVLDLPESAITIPMADTAWNYFDHGCYGSRTTYVVGRAAKDCAEELLKEILNAAATLWNIETENLAAEAGAVYQLAKPEIRLSYGEIVRRMQLEQQQNICAVSRYVADSNPAAPGVHFAEVEVDTWTGLVQVKDYLAVHDVGQAINPGMCAAQIGGAVQQGIGAALLEELTVRADGRPMPANFHQYHLVNAPDMPKVQVHLVEAGGDEGPFSAKSVGEAAIVPISAAIANAVNAALGGGCEQIPLTPVRLLAVWQQKQQGGQEDGQTMD